MKTFRLDFLLRISGVVVCVTGVAILALGGALLHSLIAAGLCAVFWHMLWHDPLPRIPTQSYIQFLQWKARQAEGRERQEILRRLHYQFFQKASLN